MTVKAEPKKAKDPVRPGKVVRGTWKVTQKIGEGGFGAVYEVKHQTTGDRAAMKVELVTEVNQVLRWEVQVLRKMQGRKNVCLYIDRGRNSKFMYAIMSLVGKSLSDLRKATSSGKFSHSTGLRVSKQCVDAVAGLHDSGFLHRDIKPSNFCMGLKDLSRTVIMLDFGLVRKFLKRGQIRPERETVGFRGTVRYASLTTHNEKDMGRVDDLWSLIYMLVELLTGALPWRKLTDRNDVAAMKRSTSPQDLFKGLSCKDDLRVIVYHLNDLKYADAPDYGLIRVCLDLAMKTADVKDDSPFDWESKGSRFKFFKGSSTEISSVSDQPRQKSPPDLQKLDSPPAVPKKTYVQAKILGSKTYDVIIPDPDLGGQSQSVIGDSGSTYRAKK